MKIAKEIGKFLLVTLLFFAVSSPFVVLFGPFDNIKRTVVGAILKSRHPQYITWLFSQEEIDRILGGISTAPKQELFKFTARTDSSLKLKNIDSSRFKGFLLEIPDPKRVQIATAENLDEKGETTSSIAKRNGAVAAINAGGFYDANGTGTGRSPYGFIIHDGKFILGQNVADGEVNEFVGLTDDGNLIAGNYSKGELISMDVKEGISFGRQPSYSIGATLRDVQNILYEEGAYIAANLDGGSSSTLYMNGNVVNKPADLLGERMIPTAFIVK